MSKRSIRDEMELLQSHDDHTQSLTNLVRDGRVDLDLSERDWQYDTILAGLEVLTVVLDRAIKTRDQQLSENADPRLEHGYDPDRL